MQFLACLHILLTCTFVLLLTYLLSTVLSYLASSVIHGSSAKTRIKRRATHASRSGRLRPIVEVDEPKPQADQAVMDWLQEEDEEDEDAIYANAETRAATISRAPAGYGEPAGIYDEPARYELTDSIFDNRIAEEGMERSDHEYYLGQTDAAEGNMEGTKQGGAGGTRLHDDEGGKLMDNGKLDEADDTGRHREAENKQIGNGSRQGESNAKESSSRGSNTSTSSSSSGKLGDAQGSGSMQQRLPPTWSDLERMVNMNSKKDLLASIETSAGLLDEY